MNNIKQIVLDVLKPYFFYEKWYYEGRIKVKNLYKDRNDIAKSIEAKISAVSIDRDKLMDMVVKFVQNKVNEYGCIEGEEDLVNLADSILSLLKPVEGLKKLKADLHQANIDKEKYFIEAEELDREVKRLEYKLKQFEVKK